MNDEHLEARVMGQQINVENVVPLLAIVEEEEMPTCENVGETSKGMLIKVKWIWKILFL
jgi:hypothetical protein